MNIDKVRKCEIDFKLEVNINRKTKCYIYKNAFSPFNMVD